MVIRDTTLAGAICGVIGAICGSILGHILQWLKLTDITFHDLAQVFILSKVYPDLLGYIIGTLAHFGVAGLLGTVFAHFSAATTNKHMIIKGTFLGVTMWLFFVGFGNYFNMPVFTNIPPLSALALWLCSATYGLTMSLTLSKLAK